MAAMNTNYSYRKSSLVKATAGLVSTVISPVTAAYSSLTAKKNDPEKGENTKNDKTDIIST
jgi:hypothetical protein